MIAFLRANQRKNVPTRGNKFFIGIAQKRPSFAESKEYLHYKITLVSDGRCHGRFLGGLNPPLPVPPALCTSAFQYV